MEIGDKVVILHGEGYSAFRRGGEYGPNGERPRYMVRFLAGEFGTIVRHTDDWYREWTVELPPHPDYPEDGPREFMFMPNEILAVPADTPFNTSAMDNHYRGNEDR